MRCYMCDLTCTHLADYEEHIDSTAHQKKLRKSAALRTQRTSVCEESPNPSVAERPTRRGAPDRTDQQEEKVRELERDLKAAREMTADVRSEVIVWKYRKNQSDVRRQAKEDENSQLVKKFYDLETELGACRADLLRYGKILAFERSTFAQRYAVADEELKAARTEIANLKSAIAERKSSVDVVESELGSTTVNLDVSKGDKREQRKKLQVLQTIVNEYLDWFEASNARRREEMEHLRRFRSVGVSGCQFVRTIDVRFRTCVVRDPRQNVEPSVVDTSVS